MPEREKLIRAVDGGGQGFRRADIYGSEIRNMLQTGQCGSADQLLDFVCGDLPKNTVGVAYAMAGEINKGNVVVKSPQIPWLNKAALADSTRNRCGIPCRVFNDMDGAVAGMAKLLPALRYFMGITWSSGIGLRIFRQGEIVAASEGGHIPLDDSPSAPLCGCGLRGCAESILGGESVKRRVIAETQALGPEALDMKIPGGVRFELANPCAFLDKAFDQGEKWAGDIYDLISQGMGKFLATYQAILRLPAVVWKGTFARNALPRIEANIRHYMRKRLINPDWEKDMKFFFSPEPQKDSLIGAASLFLQWKRDLKKMPF